MLTVLRTGLVVLALALGVVATTGTSQAGGPQYVPSGQP